MRFFIKIFFVLNCVNSIYAQSSQYHFLDYHLKNDVITINENDSHNLQFKFEFANNESDFEIEISNAIFLKCDDNEKKILENYDLGYDLNINYQSGIFKKNRIVKGSIFPFIYKNNEYQKLVFCELNIKFKDSLCMPKSIENLENSVLASGLWYKIGVSNDGIYKLDYQDLIDLGMDVSSINPKNIRIYGQRGGLLPVQNEMPKKNDLKELSIEVIGQSDASFDSNDYILFYGQSPHQWNLNSDGFFSRQQHYYDNQTYYFITADLGEGKRINSFQSGLKFDTTITSFDDYQIHENEEVNFIKSGQNWYGDVFDIVNSRIFNFNFPNINNSINIKIALAAQSAETDYSNFIIGVNDLPAQNINFSGVGGYEYARLKTFEKNINSFSDNLQINIDFNSSSTSGKGWIDYIQVNAKRILIFNGNQMNFRSSASLNKPFSQFKISNVNSNTSFWDVTDPLKPYLINGDLLGSDFYYNIPTDTLREFVAFDGGFYSPILNGKVENQNLHALKNIDYLIVSHPLFLSEANRLANFHEFSGLSLAVVTPQQIYNEFSSGSQDATAIRDFAKFLYNQENPLKYLLLFGDASYDPKNRLPNNTNFIVSFQSPTPHSATTINELYSYVTDDYFAVLDDQETIFSDGDTIPFLDIGVGRFPVQNVMDAKIVVDKVLSYNAEESYGDWRLNMCFVGDDNDEMNETPHSMQSEELADYIAEFYPAMNVDKIYLDAYEQESSTGGQRCLSVNNAISNAVNKGMFLINYNGHGGELGWAHERILEVDDLNSWSNKYKLPLFMTATCEFSRYDDPSRVSAGEQVFLKENAGAIALLTTSRVVFTGSNKDLNESFLENLFPKENDQAFPRLGDVLIRAKNNVADLDNPNHRNFTLIGDPALRLAYPKYDVVLTNIQDSAQALGIVTISGEIRQNGVKIDNYNGLVYPKVYDKRRDFQTLGQDYSPIFVFDLQKNLLFKGKASVLNGEFTFSFIVPKDINYEYGKGKISVYAKGYVGNQLSDAFGHSSDILVGGTSTNFEEDFIGPQIDLFMNDTNFIFGGITNANPNLYARLFDENGINTVSNGIGHDMVAILDEESLNPIILNDFYESDIDSYKSGVIDYPFANLSEGKHSLRLKVWDVYNNSAEKSLDFIVMSSDNLSIQNLLNYPNPVLDYTNFYFEHNQNNISIQVNLLIMDLQGRIVNQIDQNIFSNGFRYGPIRWNAYSEKNIKLNPGVYVYSLNATLPNGDKANSSGRLILLD